MALPMLAGPSRWLSSLTNVRVLRAQCCPVPVPPGRLASSCSATNHCLENGLRLAKELPTRRGSCCRPPPGVLWPVPVLIRTRLWSGSLVRGQPSGGGRCWSGQAPTGPGCALPGVASPEDAAVPRWLGPARVTSVPSLCLPQRWTPPLHPPPGPDGHQGLDEGGGGGGAAAAGESPAPPAGARVPAGSGTAGGSAACPPCRSFPSTRRDRRGVKGTPGSLAVPSGKSPGWRLLGCGHSGHTALVPGQAAAGPRHRPHLAPAGTL